MKDFLIEWETDYCEEFSEQCGVTTINAETREEAIKKFNDMIFVPKAVIMNIEEKE